MRFHHLEVTIDNDGVMRKCVLDGQDLHAKTVTIDGAAQELTTATISIIVNDITIHKLAHLVELADTQP